ncbi:hypothetical protein L7F22_016874 [Adiantum nelumboides]|nr:hypothetical protein [Adiantum nelumboides]
MHHQRECVSASPALLLRFLPTLLLPSSCISSSRHHLFLSSCVSYSPLHYQQVVATVELAKPNSCCLSCYPSALSRHHLLLSSCVSSSFPASRRRRQELAKPSSWCSCPSVGRSSEPAALLPLKEQVQPPAQNRKQAIASPASSTVAGSRHFLGATMARTKQTARIEYRMGPDGQRINAPGSEAETSQAEGEDHQEELEFQVSLVNPLQQQKRK